MTSCLIAILTAPLAKEAEPKTTPPRVGVISILSAAAAGPNVSALKEGLEHLGYVDGKTIAIDIRAADGNFDRLPSFTAELVRNGARVIVVGGTTPAISVNKVTAAVPIVFVSVSDPVGAGLAISLARPGGNATGLATAHEDAYAGKALELLKEAAPLASRVAVLHNPSNPFNVRFLKAVTHAADQFGVATQGVAASTTADLETGLIAIRRQRPGALVVASDPFLVARRVQIVAALIEQKLPAIFGFSEYVTAGGLMSYGANNPDMYRRAASFIDKILKGAKPADLPIEQPTKFELVINMKTAKVLGLTIPPALLLRADHVIE